MAVISQGNFVVTKRRDVMVVTHDLHSAGTDRYTEVVDDGRNSREDLACVFHRNRANAQTSA